MTSVLPTATDSSDTMIQLRASTPVFGDDKAAIAEYFSLNRGFLTAMANRIADDILDPGDLLGTALLSLLEKWKVHRGPTDHVNAYLVTSMKNRVRDELRAPRKRVLALEVVAEPIVELSDTSSIDMYSEYSVLRRALRDLPDDQRDVIVATVVEGRKPRELVTELNRPAAAIYSLRYRALSNLRQSLVRVILEDCPTRECSSDAVRLATLIASTDHGIDEACRICAARWDGLRDRFVDA